MIRTLQPHDLEQVMELWLRGNLEAHAFVPRAYWEANAPAVRDQLPQAEVYVYETDGVLLGFAGLQGDDLAGIFVAGSARSQGIGRALLDHVKALRPSFSLHVYRDNRRAVDFYRREGLTVTARGVDEDTGQAEYTMTWEACPAGPRLVKLREEPALMEAAARWFHARWQVPLEAYRESMEQCLTGKDAVPQWYVLRDDRGTILAGAGVIENDFHDRPDLSPNLCALYVEAPYRGRGLARRLLDAVRRDLADLGIHRLYLVTDHTDFYERCGWEFLTLVRDREGEPERLYAVDTE